MAIMKQQAGCADDDWATFPEDAWTQFACTETAQSSAFEQCFRSPTLECPPLQSSPPGSLCLSERHWSELHSCALLPDPTLPSLSARPPETRPPPLDLPGDSDTFNWSTEDKVEILPSLFKPAKPESPIDIQFDHSRAALGLATLTLEELRAMNEEMRTKFNRLSRVLVEGLEERDALVGELDVKNRFVAAILRVQSLRVSNGDDGRGRKRAWSLKQADERGSKKYLHSVLPYNRPDDLSWPSDLLTALTNILQAIAEHSDRVPVLVSDYIQEHIIESRTENSKWTEPL